MIIINNFNNRPKNPNTKIWRYMDLTKYLSILKTSSLYFPRSDLLGDQFEGSFPPRNLQKREISYNNLFPHQERSKFNEAINKFSIGQANLHKFMIPRVYINCWHASSYESHAMWGLYSQTGKGIAIRSTYGRLRESLPSEINIGLVKYISYSKNSKDTIPEDITIAPFFY